MPHPDEGLIHAWLDGELPPEEAARVERLVHEDAEWGAAASEARGLVAASSRILDALDSVPANVLRGRPDSAPRWSVRPWMRVAAGLVLVAGTAVVVSERSGVPSRLGRVADSEVARSQPSASATSTEPPAASTEPSAQGRPAPTATGAEPLVQESRAPSQKAAGTSDTAAPSAQGASRSRESAAGVTPQRTEQELQDRRALTSPIELPMSANAAPARSEGGFGTAAPMRQPQRALAATAAVVEGCWRTLVGTAADSVLVTPRVVRSASDTLVILVRADGSANAADADAATRTATVVQTADTLAGTMLGARGTRVPFRALRIPCRE